MTTAPSAPESSLRQREIVAAARDLLEAEGPGALSMRRIADRIDLTAGALYKHVRDKRELENALIAAGLVKQGERAEAAVAAGEDPLWDLAGAFRAFAIDHPHLYRLMTERDLDRDPVVGPAEDFSREVFRRAAEGEQVARLTMWAFCHGMVMLELNERFPPGSDIEATWRRGIDALRALFPHLAGTDAPAG